MFAGPGVHPGYFLIYTCLSQTHPHQFLIVSKESWITSIAWLHTFFVFPVCHMLCTTFCLRGASDCCFQYWTHLDKSSEVPLLSLTNTLILSVLKTLAAWVTTVNCTKKAYFLNSRISWVAAVLAQWSWWPSTDPEWLATLCWQWR